MLRAHPPPSLPPSLPLPPSFPPSLPPSLPPSIHPPPWAEARGAQVREPMPAPRFMQGARNVCMCARKKSCRAGKHTIGRDKPGITKGVLSPLTGWPAGPTGSRLHGGRHRRRRPGPAATGSEKARSGRPDRTRPQASWCPSRVRADRVRVASESHPSDVRVISRSCTSSVRVVSELNPSRVQVASDFCPSREIGRARAITRCGPRTRPRHGPDVTRS